MALNDSKSVGTKHTVKYVNKLALNKQHLIKVGNKKLIKYKNLSKESSWVTQDQKNAKW